MPKINFWLIFLISFLALIGCSTSSYEKSIKNDLLIPYPYIPPNNAFHPYTLLQFTPNGGFQEICSASLMTGLSENEIQHRRKKSLIADLNVKKNHKAAFDINLSMEDLGTANAKYLDIKKVEISFQNGNQVSIPSVHPSDAIKNMRKTKCKDDIKVFKAEIPDSKFLIPTIVFSYDMKYHLIDKDGIDVTAELSKELQNIVLGKIGVSFENTSAHNMAGNNLYIGFRGLPVKSSIVFLSEGRIYAGVPPPGAKVPNKKDWNFIDVTEEVKAIASSNQ